MTEDDILAALDTLLATVAVRRRRSAARVACERGKDANWACEYIMDGLDLIEEKDAKMARHPTKRALRSHNVVAPQLINATSNGAASSSSYVALEDGVYQTAAAAVLASYDILALVLTAPLLYLWHGQAACVCKTWQRVWADTRMQRRGLRDATQVVGVGVHDGPMAAMPSGEFAVADLSHPSCGVRLYDTELKMRRLAFVDRMFAAHSLALTPDDLYICGRVFNDPGNQPPAISVVRRVQLSDGATLNEQRGVLFASMALGPGDVLFGLPIRSSRQQRVVALDRFTLMPRFEFGHEQLADSSSPLGLNCTSLAVGGGSVFVAATVAQSPCVHIFSLTGEHWRTLRGDALCGGLLTHPGCLHFVSDKLLVSEKKGQRIFVLTLEGAILQQFRPVVWQSFMSEWTGIRMFVPAGERLMVNVAKPERPSGQDHPDYGLVQRAVWESLQAIGSRLYSVPGLW